VALVSVLMPYRDAGDTIEEAARSVLAQEGVEIELVAVDDGSRDGGPARMRALAGGDARVRLVATGAGGERRGGGIVAALARGLAEARGEVVARMDADDVALPGRLAAQVRFLDRDARLGAVGIRVSPLGACGEGMRLYIEWQNALVTPEDHAREIFVESPLCHPSVALRREALLDTGGWRDCAWAEDYDLWLRLDARGWKLAKVPDVGLLWRQRTGRATFTDPRYARDRFREARAFYLAPKLLRAGRPVVVWGAGPTGRRLARDLEAQGVKAARFVDIDPRKIGRTARGVAIVAADALRPADQTVVVAVGARGARALVRARLVELGFVEGRDFVCAA
jgi:glycosyltransferase involved in cell wall biosynthesis